MIAYEKTPCVAAEHVGMIVLLANCGERPCSARTLRPSKVVYVGMYLPQQLKKARRSTSLPQYQQHQLSIRARLFFIVSAVTFNKLRCGMDPERVHRMVVFMPKFRPHQESENNHLNGM